MILAKIKIGQQINLININEKYYIINNSQFTINTEQLLRDQGYDSGKFNITYYVYQNERIYNNPLKVKALSSNKLQCKCQFVNLVNTSSIYEFQNYFQQNNSSTYVIALNYNKEKLNLISHLKYNFFKDIYVLRFVQNSQYNLNDTFYMFKLLYQPLSQIYNLQAIFQEYTEKYITLQNPNFNQKDFQYENIQNVTLTSLLNYTQSIYNLPLSIANMSQTVYYDPYDPYSFVHFGTYNSRLNAFILKYTEIQAVSNSLVYPSASIAKIIEGFNTFERYCFTDTSLINTQSHTNSILSMASTGSIQFINWYATMSITASNYDAINLHSLINFLPQAIRYDSRNDDLITLVNLMGDTFDQYWAAIKGIPAITARLQSDLQTYNQAFLKSLLNNYGFSYQNSFPTEQLPAIYTEFKDVLDQNLSYNQYNKILMARLLANMPFLIKSKGTRYCLQQILNIYGFSQNLIRIHQFTKDSYTGSNVVDIIKPYYNTSKADLIFTKSDIEPSAVVTYFRISQSFNDQIIKGLIPYYTGLQTSSQYCLIMYSGSSDRNYKLYNQSTVLTSSIITSSLNYITYSAGLYVDNIKLLNTTSSNINNLISIYIMGSNIIDNNSHVDFIYDLNSFNPLIKNSTYVTVSYNNAAIEIGKFSTLQYSSIFSLGNTPSKFYSIQTHSEQIPLFISSLYSEVVNYPNIHIGSLYSDNFNSTFIIDYQKRFENLLDNNQYLQMETFSNFKYKQLQKYRNLYGNYYNCINDVGYSKLVKFYQKMDSTIFKTIKTFSPNNVNIKYGLILDNNILYRNKIPTIQYTKKGIEKRNVQIQNLNLSPIFKITTNNKIQGHDKIKINVEGVLYNKIQGKTNVPDQKISGKLYNNCIGKYTQNNGTSIIIYGDTVTVRGLKTNINYYYQTKIINKPRVGIGEAIRYTSSIVQRKMIIDESKKLNVTNITI